MLFPSKISINTGVYNKMIKIRKKYFVCIILIFISFLIPANVYGDGLNILVKRLAGDDRYGTSEEICEYGWTSNSDYAIVTTGEDFPDALSAAPFAKIYNAPVLITKSNQLDSKAISELKRLKVNKVFIIGGTGAVSQSVEKIINSSGITTERLYGANRYETSTKIAEKMDTKNGVVLVSGDDYPGALFMAPIAAKKGMPIILVQRDSIPDCVKGYLKNKNIPKYYVIGDENIISRKVTDSLTNVERITGKDKYDRNLNAISKFSDIIDFSKIYIATGQNFPDALSGSAMAARTGSPIILMVNKTLSQEAIKFINQRISKVKEIYMLGGESVVAPINLDSSGIASYTDDDTLSGGINSKGNSDGNIINGGYAASQGNYVYYTYKSGYGLYRMKKDGSGIVLLTSDMPRYINVIGEWVYYSNLSDNGKIYKIKTDGSVKLKICDDSAKYINVENSTIYYSNQSYAGNVYRVNIDGTKRLSICKVNADYLSLDNDFLYYSDISKLGNIYRIKNDGTNEFKINYCSSKYVLPCGNYVYYIDYYGDGDIYRSKLDGTFSEKLNALSSQDDYVSSINMFENYLYFNVKNKSGYKALYKMNNDGTDKVLIGTGYDDNLTIINGVVLN